MAIADFNALMALEGPTLLGDTRDIVNYVQRKTWTPSFLIAGRDDEEIFKSGPTLQDHIYLDKVDVGEWYDPNGLERNETNPQTTVQVTANWRYYITSLTWQRQEVEHSAPSNSGDSYITHQYKDLIFSKKQNLGQALCDTLETSYWRVPNYADMEGANAVVPYSIPTFICEAVNSTGIGVPTDADGLQNDWVTMQGLSLTTTDNLAFDNKRLTYSNTGGTRADGDDLIGVMKRMRRQLKYQALPKDPEFGNAASVPNACLASDIGMTYIEGGLRAGQDTWGAKELEDGDLMIGGVRVHYIEELDTLAVYDDGGSLDNEMGAGVTGPRFYYVSQEGLSPKFFEGMFLESDEPMKDVRQPLNYVQHYHLWAQLWCRNRRFLGIVSPDVSV
jgi:hypothetical protein